MARGDEATDLMPHEQTAVTLAALVVEGASDELLEPILEQADGLFDGYCLPRGGRHPGSRRVTYAPGRVYMLAGEPVLLLCRSSGPGPRNALFLRPDGTKTCRPFRGVRRLRLREGRTT